MNDKDFAPLSPACVRALNDKMYEKRKGAALEIEKMVRDFLMKNSQDQVSRVLKILGDDFAMSLNPQPRKGGLIGLAACAIALGKDSGFYASSLVRPVLSCFHDPDSRVRYYACESLYNIVKVARGSVLPHFNEIFDGLSKLAADPDQNVRSGSETLDRLMKDVVTESSAFDLMSFIPLLRERIYVTNSFARRFIVSWINMLDATPDIDMLVFLPEILDGMFKILGDVQPEISKQCEVSFGEFLRGISSAPPGRVNFKGMVNIVLSHCMAQDSNKDLIQYTAILWLKEFVQLAGQDMLMFASGIITAILPCLAMGDRQKSIREVAKAVNSMMMKLLSSEDSEETEEGVLNDLSKSNIKDEEANEGVKEGSEDVSSEDPSLVPEPLDLSAVVKVLCKHLMSKKMETRIASLQWIYHLLIKTPNKIFQHVEEIFPLLLKSLSDPADEVVLLDLEVLAEISSCTVTHTGAAINTNEQAALPSPIKKAVSFEDGMNTYFTKFMISLLGMFRTDSQLLENRGSFIIRQLCLLLQAEHIYQSLAEILLHEDDLKFASVMIQTLNTILLTSTELFDLRNQLREFRTQESHTLFTCLYRSWCHNPVATVSLCLLTQSYKHSCELLQYFGDLEVTVDFLTEIDKLIQLLESPIFTFLRLQLLDLGNNQYLVKSLYGLLMLIPQSEAFRTLRNRLECVPNVRFSVESPSKNEPRSTHDGIDFQELLNHFEDVQVKHRENRRKMRQQLVSRTS